MIEVLRKKFNCEVGYSGHEKGGVAISYKELHWELHH